MQLAFIARLIDKRQLYEMIPPVLNVLDTIQGDTISANKAREAVAWVFTHAAKRARPGRLHTLVGPLWEVFTDIRGFDNSSHGARIAVMNGLKAIAERVDANHYPMLLKLLRPTFETMQRMVLFNDEESPDLKPALSAMEAFMLTVLLRELKVEPGLTYKRLWRLLMPMTRGVGLITGIREVDKEDEGFVFAKYGDIDELRRLLSVIRKDKSLDLDHPQLENYKAQILARYELDKKLVAAENAVEDRAPVSSEEEDIWLRRSEVRSGKATGKLMSEANASLSLGKKGSWEYFEATEVLAEIVASSRARAAQEAKAKLLFYASRKNANLETRAAAAMALIRLISRLIQNKSERLDEALIEPVIQALEEEGQLEHICSGGGYDEELFVNLIFYMLLDLVTQSPEALSDYAYDHLLIFLLSPGKVDRVITWEKKYQGRRGRQTAADAHTIVSKINESLKRYALTLPIEGAATKAEMLFDLLQKQLDLKPGDTGLVLAFHLLSFLKLHQFEVPMGQESDEQASLLMLFNRHALDESYLFVKYGDMRALDKILSNRDRAIIPVQLERYQEQLVALHDRAIAEAVLSEQEGGGGEPVDGQAGDVWFENLPGNQRSEVRDSQKKNPARVSLTGNRTAIEFSTRLLLSDIDRLSHDRPKGYRLGISLAASTRELESEKLLWLLDPLIDVLGPLERAVKEDVDNRYPQIWAAVHTLEVIAERIDVRDFPRLISFFMLTLQYVLSERIGDNDSRTIGSMEGAVLLTTSKNALRVMAQRLLEKDPATWYQPFFAQMKLSASPVQFVRNAQDKSFKELTEVLTRVYLEEQSITDSPEDTGELRAVLETLFSLLDEDSGHALFPRYGDMKELRSIFEKERESDGDYSEHNQSLILNQLEAYGVQLIANHQRAVQEERAPAAGEDLTPPGSMKDHADDIWLQHLKNRQRSEVRSVDRVTEAHAEVRDGTLSFFVETVADMVLNFSGRAYAIEEKERAAEGIRSEVRKMGMDEFADQVEAIAQRKISEQTVRQTRENQQLLTRQQANAELAIGHMVSAFRGSFKDQLQAVAVQGVGQQALIEEVFRRLPNTDELLVLLTKGTEVKEKSGVRTQSIGVLTRAKPRVYSVDGVSNTPKTFLPVIQFGSEREDISDQAQLLSIESLASDSAKVDSVFGPFASIVDGLSRVLMAAASGHFLENITDLNDPVKREMLAATLLKEGVLKAWGPDILKFDGQTLSINQTMIALMAEHLGKAQLSRSA